MNKSKMENLYHIINNNINNNNNNNINITHKIREMLDRVYHHYPHNKNKIVKLKEDLLIHKILIKKNKKNH